MLSKKSLFLLSLLCVGLVFCEDPAPAAHEEEGGKTPATDVIELNAESFDKTIAANKVILVEFYATWCGHCQKFAPTYDRIATALKAESIPVARINAAENDEVSQAQKIEGFPTIRLFVNGKGIEYRGRREFDDVISFVHKGVQPALLALGSKAEVDSFLAANPTTVIACFGDPETGLSQKSLSLVPVTIQMIGLTPKNDINNPEPTIWDFRWDPFSLPSLSM